MQETESFINPLVKAVPKARAFWLFLKKMDKIKCKQEARGN